MASSGAGDAVEVALRALQRRELSEQELDARLARAGIDQPERAATIARLADVGLVSDARYASERASALARRGFGDEAIRADLRRHGANSDAADAAIGSLTPEAERAAQHFARRGGGERALRYLAARGFSQDALESLAAADEVR